MNAPLAIAAFLLTGFLPGKAQNVQGEPTADPVLDAIQEFKERDRKQPVEVAVVLDAEGVPPGPTGPLLVTGKPPENPMTNNDPPDSPVTEITAPETEAPASGAAVPETGLVVRVEKLQSGTGDLDPSKVKLRAPFPAKPLAQPPTGWRLDPSETAPPFSREVEISPGSKITLTIYPHILVPDADGAEIFTIAEPGYDKALGYQQTATVGAILSNSVRRLDDESKQLGIAIDSLQQLLVSLPKPPEAQPETKPAILRKK